MTSTTISSRPGRPTGGKKITSGSVTITMSDFQTYEMQARQMECRKWIESVVNEELESSDLHQSLKDGVMLCKLANIMFPGIITKYNRPGSVTFKLIENINTFLIVPKKMGINENQIFIATDLWENKNMPKVIGTLNSMANIANSKGFPVKWPIVDDPESEPKTQFQDQTPTYTWENSFIYSNNNNGNGTPNKSFGRNSVLSPSTVKTTSSPASSPYRSSNTTSIPSPSFYNKTTTNTNSSQPPESPKTLPPKTSPTSTSSQSLNNNAKPPITTPTPQPTLVPATTTTTTTTTTTSPTTPVSPPTPVPTTKIEDEDSKPTTITTTIPITPDTILTSNETINNIPIEDELNNNNNNNNNQYKKDKIKNYENQSKESKDLMEPIHLATKEGEFEMVCEIAQPSNVNSATIHGRTALHFAVAGNHIEILQYLLVEQKADPNLSDTDGNTPLHLAIIQGLTLAVEALLKNGANVNAINKDGSTPIMMVSLNGEEKIVDLLLEYGADVNSSNKKGNTALHYATLRGHKKVVDKLLEAGSDVNAVNQDGATSLHVAAEENYPTIIETLANSGACVDHQRLDGWTPLYTAAYKGNIETALSLLSMSASVDSHNLEGWTPLHAACAEGHLQMAELLIDTYKADINRQNSQGTTPLFHSCSQGHLDLVKMLISHGADPELSRPGGWKPIHIACYNENDDITRYLIEEVGVDLNCTNTEIKDYAPIHILISTEEPRLEIIELLLKKNTININQKNINGSTPLHLAVFWNHFKILQLLLKYNANLDIKNNKGRTPLSLACHYGNEEIAKFLAEKMHIDVKKLKIKNNKQKILDMEVPDAPPVPE
eukprot:gene2243-2765_t